MPKLSMTTWLCVASLLGVLGSTVYGQAISSKPMSEPAAATGRLPEPQPSPTTSPADNPNPPIAQVQYTTPVQPTGETLWTVEVPPNQVANVRSLPSNEGEIVWQLGAGSWVALNGVQHQGWLQTTGGRWIHGSLVVPKR